MMTGADERARDVDAGLRARIGGTLVYILAEAGACLVEAWRARALGPQGGRLAAVTTCVVIAGRSW